MRTLVASLLVALGLLSDSSAAVEAKIAMRLMVPR
jgi:hypothetical protein